MKARLSALAPEVRAALGARIDGELRRELEAATDVALYASLPDEVPSGSWLERRFREDQRVWLPRLRPDGALDFVPIHGPTDLEAGPYGLRQPRAGLRPGALEALDAVVVPALAIDERGVRLGRGGGYYDRTFAGRSPRPTLIGVVFDFQRVPSLPREPHDLCVDRILTERGTSTPR